MSHGNGIRPPGYAIKVCELWRHALDDPQQRRWARITLRFENPAPVEVATADGILFEADMRPVAWPCRLVVVDENLPAGQQWFDNASRWWNAIYLPRWRRLADVAEDLIQACEIESVELKVSETTAEAGRIVLEESIAAIDRGLHSTVIRHVENGLWEPCDNSALSFYDHSAESLFGESLQCLSESSLNALRFARQLTYTDVFGQCEPIDNNCRRTDFPVNLLDAWVLAECKLRDHVGTSNGFCEAFGLEPIKAPFGINCGQLDDYRETLALILKANGLSVPAIPACPPSERKLANADWLEEICRRIASSSNTVSPQVRLQRMEAIERDVRMGRLSAAVAAVPAIPRDNAPSSDKSGDGSDSGDERTETGGKSSGEPAAKDKPPVRTKKSTQKGDAKEKLSAALVTHHKYKNGRCGQTEPIQNNALARLAGVSRSSAARFFTSEFEGYQAYRRKCTNGRVVMILAKLAKDVDALDQMVQLAVEVNAETRMPVRNSRRSVPPTGRDDQT